MGASLQLTLAAELAASAVQMALLELLAVPAAELVSEATQGDDEGPGVEWEEQLGRLQLTATMQAEFTSAQGCYGVAWAHPSEWVPPQCPTLPSYLADCPAPPLHFPLLPLLNFTVEQWREEHPSCTASLSHPPVCRLTGPGCLYQPSPCSGGTAAGRAAGAAGSD